MKNSTRSLHVIIDTDIVPENYEQIIDEMNKTKSKIVSISLDDVEYENKTTDLLIILSDQIKDAGFYQTKLIQASNIIKRLSPKVKTNIKSKEKQTHNY